MASKGKSKIFTHLWYANEAEEAARFYASLFEHLGQRAGRPLGRWPCGAQCGKRFPLARTPASIRSGAR